MKVMFGVILVLFFLTFLSSNGTEVAANGDETPAVVCPLDHVPVTGDARVTTGKSGSLEGLLCRPFTDAECSEKYGEVTVFKSEYKRCFWTLPTGVTAPSLRAIPNTSIDPDRCAFIRLLHVMLSALRPDGGLVLPLAESGQTGIPLRCGTVDLRAWSPANPSAVSGVATAVSVVHGGAVGKKAAAPTPVWVWVSLVLLGLFAVGCVTGSAIIARRLFLGRKGGRSFQAEDPGNSSVASSGKTHSVTVSNDSSLQDSESRTSPGVLTQLPFPSLAEQSAELTRMNLEDSSTEPATLFCGHASMCTNP